jgi:two-component system response regulator TctD
MKFLLVEDNHALSFCLSGLLGQSGNVVEQAFSGEEALQLLLTQTYDAIFLELDLPGIKGLALLKYLRKNNITVPVLIMSSHGRMGEMIECFNQGADDYLKPPYSFPEIEARLSAIVRRSMGRASPVVSCGSLQYDAISKRFSSSGIEMLFPPREHAVLELMISAQGRTFSKKELAEGLCTLEDWISPKALEIYFTRIRRKIEHTGAQITTFRGRGYMLSFDCSSKPVVAAPAKVHPVLTGAQWRSERTSSLFS